jgi:hypothetical protein
VSKDGAAMAECEFTAKPAARQDRGTQGHAAPARRCHKRPLLEPLLHAVR